MKKYILVILPLLIMSLAGCERKPKFKMDIYVNTDVEICGIKDPMNNIDRLKEDLDYYSTTEREFSLMYDYCIYEDSIGNQFVVIVRHSSHTNIVAWNCDKSVMFGGVWFNPQYDFENIPPTTPQGSNSQVAPIHNKREDSVDGDSPQVCYECDEFFATHTFVGFIARIRNTLID